MKFGDTEIINWKFHFPKSPAKHNNVDVDKILMSDRFACGKKSSSPTTKMIKS